MKRLFTLALFIGVGVFSAIASEKNDSTANGSAVAIANEKTETAAKGDITSLKKSISVTKGSAGDVNNDGQLDVADIAELYSYLNTDDGPVNPAQWNETAANVDGNKKINNNDLTALVNYVLTGTKPE